RSGTTSCARSRRGRWWSTSRSSASIPRCVSRSDCYPRDVRGFVAVAIVTIAATTATGCWSGDYLAKQGVGQLRLLRARRRIDDVLADPSVSAETKRRLTLARDAREFGVRVLGLHGGDGFTRFVDSHGAPIAWNVTAAKEDKLEPHLRHFPGVGAIPYLGFC